MFKKKHWMYSLSLHLFHTIEKNIETKREIEEQNRSNWLKKIRADLLKFWLSTLFHKIMKKKKTK